jgi:hypothetical protein
VRVHRTHQHQLSIAKFDAHQVPVRPQAGNRDSNAGTSGKAAGSNEFRRELSLGMSWLGGRDSNPDTVVQRAVPGLRYASLRAFPGRSNRESFRPLRSVSVRSRAACLIVSHARPWQRRRTCEASSLASDVLVMGGVHTHHRAIVGGERGHDGQSRAGLTLIQAGFVWRAAYRDQQRVVFRLEGRTR